MIDERIVYYLVSIISLNIIMYYLWIWKSDVYFFVFDDSCNDSKTRRNYLLMLIVILCFFLDIVLSEGRQLPAIINESHQIVKGTIIKKEEWEKKSQGYSLWKTKNYKLTLKKDNGEELYIKGTRAPNLERGMRVEIRLHEAKSMDPIVVSVNGNETEIYQRECAVTDIEKIVVFMIYLIISSLMIKSLNRQYVIKGNRQYGKKWYYSGIVSVFLWIMLAGMGIKGTDNHKWMGNILCIAYTIIYACIFRLTWVVHPEDSKRLVEILKGHYECNTTIELERIPETEVQGYCTYKRDRLEEELSILWIVEPVAILLTVAVYILWNNKWKWLVITVLFVLSIMILIIKVRTFRRNTVALKKAMVSGLEYAQVTFDLRELKKYQGTDGEIIWAKMRFDDDGELEDGDMAIAVRAVGTDVVFIEQEKKLSEILKEHYKYRRTIELERMSGIETKRYCVYKKKKLRKKFIEFLILEASMIWLVAVVYILWESRLKWIAITAMIVGIVVALYMKERTFRRNFSALKKAPKFGLECAKVKITYRELRKYQGTDGEIIGAEMRLDDDGKLEDGDMAIAVRAVGTDVVFIEPEVVMQGIRGEML